MAYNRNFNNNNNSRYNGNGGYKNNNYDRYDNGFRPQNRPAFNGFDASKFKKPDIEIKGLTGSIYRISGNFSLAFASQMLKTMERVDKITKGNLSDIEKFPELYDLLKDWTLALINLNTDGITYSMDAVTKDFNDLYVMNALLQYIGGFMSKDASETVKAIESETE